MTRYLTAEEVLYLHYRIIEATGGSHGVLNLGSLQSALARPQARFGGKELLPDTFAKAAALMEFLVNNHPFVDGNKRIGIAAAGIFLELNGSRLIANNDELSAFALMVATGKAKVQEMAAWFKTNSRPV